MAQSTIMAKKNTIIVSFTTINSRINAIKPVVDSILNQTLLPDSFELYISDHPSLFEGGIDQGIPPNKIPQFLRDYEQQNKLKIKYVDNIGPANKLIPCLRENWGTDNIIITIDDDVIYARHFIETLHRYYEQEKCLVATMGLEVVLKPDFFSPGYYKWKWLTKTEKSLYNFSLGFGGCLYTPRFFDALVLDEQCLLAITPTEDDIWFYFMRLLKKTPALILGNEILMRNAASQDKNLRLNLINRDQGKNKEAFEKIIKFLHNKNIDPCSL